MCAQEEHVLSPARLIAAATSSLLFIERANVCFADWTLKLSKALANLFHEAVYTAVFFWAWGPVSVVLMTEFTDWPGGNNVKRSAVAYFRMLGIRSGSWRVTSSFNRPVSNDYAEIRPQPLIFRCVCQSIDVF
jgi:ammonia channel protein AmtB